MPYLSSISASEFCEKLGSGEARFVVDVRQPDEYAQGCLPGSICHPLQQISSRRLQQELGTDHAGEPVYLLCGIGRRAAIAGQQLLAEGFPRDLVIVEGGLDACVAAQAGQ